MNTIGIDFSLNYSSICVSNDDKLYYYSLIRSERQTKKQNSLINELGKINCQQTIYLPKNQEIEDDYSKKEINKILDANIITKEIINIINKYDKISNIIIEGFSFGSLGQRALELGGYQFILRKEILELKDKNLKILAPSTIKKTAGKGNYSKIEMFKAYVNNSSQDNILENCNVRKFILNNQENIFINNKTILEPVCGLIDSYWVQRTFSK